MKAGAERFNNGRTSGQAEVQPTTSNREEVTINPLTVNRYYQQVPDGRGGVFNMETDIYCAEVFRRRGKLEPVEKVSRQLKDGYGQSIYYLNGQPFMEKKWEPIGQNLNNMNESVEVYSSTVHRSRAGIDEGYEGYVVRTTREYEFVIKTDNGAWEPTGEMVNRSPYSQVPFFRPAILNLNLHTSLKK